MVIYIELICGGESREKLKELFHRVRTLKGGTFVKRNSKSWAHTKYRGSVRFKARANTSIVDVSIIGSEEDMLTGALIGWILRNANDIVSMIQLYPQW